MQTLLMVASLLAVVTGIIHSLLGEWLIFRHLRAGSLVPSLPAPPLPARHVRILWATWHLASVLAWALAGMLFQISQGPVAARWLLGATACAFLAGSLLVLVGTRGRHPGWIALAVVGILSWLAITGV